MKKGKIYVGTSGWSYKHWKGTFYPENIKSKDQFEYYQKIFATVELNSSFYHLPSVKEVKADTGLVTQYMRVKNNNTGLYKEPMLNTAPAITLPAGSLIKVIAATDNLYKIRLPGNEEGFIKSNLITNQPLRQQKLPVASSLLDMPDTTAAIKKILNEGSEVTLLGTYKDYYYTQWQNSYGWIRK